MSDAYRVPAGRSVEYLRISDGREHRYIRGHWYPGMKSEGTLPVDAVPVAWADLPRRAREQATILGISPGAKP